jgi:4-aminobutyrate aminotransferase-like enzyme
VSSTINPTQPKNQRAQLVTAVPGPKSQELRRREDAHMAPGLQGYAVMAGIVVKEGRGSTVTDVDGNTFVDLIGGIAVNALGHSHPTFVAAIQEQVAAASVGSFTSPARVELVERLAARPPAPGLHRLQPYSGGTEAVESALRLAKSHTGKYEFIGFWGGFHGKTMGSLSLMGSTFKPSLGPWCRVAIRCRAIAVPCTRPIPAAAWPAPSCSASMPRKQRRAPSRRSSSSPCRARRAT